MKKFFCLFLCLLMLPLASLSEEVYPPRTYESFKHKCLELSHRFNRFGIGAGDKVAILSSNMPNWTVAMFSCVPFGRVTVPILPDSSASEVANILHHSACKAIFVSQQQLSKLSQEVIGAYVLYPGRCGKSFDYGTIIERENIGAIPLLPCHKGEENSDKDGEKALRVFLDKILGKSESGEHLASAKSTRGTTVVVGKGFSEESIPTIVLQPNEWPNISGSGAKFISVPYSQCDKMPASLPALVRLKSNNKAEVIVKVLELRSDDGAHKNYSIESTPEGYTG